MLHCENLIKNFDSTRAVDSLNLRVREGEIFGLLGPNGSGKTTTIRVALGIYRPDGGSIRLLGDPDPLNVRQQVGYLPEERGLYPKMKVVEQLSFLATIRGLSTSEAKHRASEWLNRLGLGERAQSLTNELSKGMQQKVQFAAAVIHEPKLVVLDEPFGGLDPINTRLLKDLILEQKRLGTTIVLSTHRMDQVEALCDSICLIHEGRDVLNGALQEIKASYGRSTLNLEYDGQIERLKEIPGVRSVLDSGNTARLQMSEGADPQQILRTLLDRVAVKGFRVEEPHVEEIYIERVGKPAKQDEPALEKEVLQ